MTSHPSGPASLHDAASLDALLAAARDAFEFLLTVTRGHQDPADGMFAAFVMSAASAADGRDALAAAPSLPWPPPGQHAGAADGLRPGTAAEVAACLAALSQQLAARLAQAASTAHRRRGPGRLRRGRPVRHPDPRAAHRDGAVMPGATFGDFARAAGAHLDVAGPTQPSAASRPSRRSLAACSRITAVMARYPPTSAPRSPMCLPGARTRSPAGPAPPSRHRKRWPGHALLRASRRASQRPGRPARQSARWPAACTRRPHP